MMTTIKNKIESATLQVQDINVTLRSVTKYAWLSAGVLFACYLYFVGAITFSVVKQGALAHTIKSVVSETSKEELKYLTMQKNLTEQYATSIGFITAPTLSYATSQKAFAWNVNAGE